MSGSNLPAKHEIIMSKPDQSFAVGIYSPASDLLESQVQWRCEGPMGNGGCVAPAPLDPSTYQALVLDTFNYQGLTTSYGHNEAAFMVVGSYATVLQRLQQIYRGY